MAYAIDAATGKQIWAYDPYDGGGGGGVGRGVTYWESGDDKRIFYAAGYIISLRWMHAPAKLSKVLAKKEK